MSHNANNEWNKILVDASKYAQELQGLLSEGNDTSPEVFKKEAPACFKHITKLVDYINKNMNEMVSKNPGNETALSAISKAYAGLSKPLPKSDNANDTAGLNTIVSSIQTLSASGSSQKGCGSKDCKDKPKKCA